MSVAVMDPATVESTPDGPRPDRGDVLSALCLLQAAFVLLGGVGEVLLMGGAPAYLALPALKAVLLAVFASRAAAGRRWALITVIVVELVTLTGFWLQLVGGLLLPWFDFTVNLAGLLTGVGVPGAVIWLCTAHLRDEASRRRPLAPSESGLGGSGPGGSGLGGSGLGGSGLGGSGLGEVAR